VLASRFSLIPTSAHWLSELSLSRSTAMLCYELMWVVMKLIGTVVHVARSSSRGVNLSHLIPRPSLHSIPSQLPDYLLKLSITKGLLLPRLLFLILASRMYRHELLRSIPMVETVRPNPSTRGIPSPLIQYDLDISTLYCSRLAFSRWTNAVRFQRLCELCNWF